jgi:hypothetical protein
MTMKLVLGTRPKLAEPAEAGSAIYGAVKWTRTRASDPALLYIIIKMEDAQKTDNVNRDDLILGDSEDIIEERLESLYPCEDKQCSRVHRGRFEIGEEDNTRRASRYSRSARYDINYVEAWEITKEPLAFGIEDIETLKELVLRNRVVLISNNTLDRLGDKELTAAGFIVRTASRMRFRVSYNPDLLAQKATREVVARIKARMVEMFPLKLMFLLFQATRPSKWPEHHPFKDSVGNHGCKTVYMDEEPNYTRNDNVESREIMQQLALSRKLWPKGEPWWREYEWSGTIDGEYKVLSWTFLISEALRYIHGVEAGIAKRATALAAWRKEIDEEFKNDKVAGLTNDDQIDQYYQHANSKQETIDNDKALCRWIRREARALKLPIPAPPKLPETKKGRKR